MIVILFKMQSYNVKSFAVLLLVVMVAMSVASAIPKPDGEHKSRVIDKELSDQEHYENDEHNPDYDHEAFLGAEEAKTFEDLSPEESKERLAIIYDKIDKDKDGFVTEEELRDWIKYVQNKYLISDTDSQWADQDTERDGTALSWDTYKKRTYGFMDDEQDDDEYNAYGDMMVRDERRWLAADVDKDGYLSKEEYTHFLHPEDAPHMRSVVIEETIKDIDKDGDGKISLDEYIGDMWPDKGQDEPDWVKTEREQFANFRDKNGDGVMDAQEVQDWIMPPDYDHSEAEAKHLMFESDIDKDTKLTKAEVLEKYDIFVGSQATDFGAALTNHDEF